MNLSPLPKVAFLDSNGRPLVGGLLFTYISGTSTKQTTYIDEAGSQSNTNPVVLDYRGEANVWLDPSKSYKFVLSPAGDTDPPTKPIWSVSDIVAPISISDLTQQIVGQILWPQTPAEIAAGVTPTNYGYAPGDLRRYGCDITGGTDNDTQIANALSAAVAAGGIGFVYHPGGTIRHASKITIPNKVTIFGIDRSHCEFSYTGTGIGWQNLNGPNSSGYANVNMFGLKLTATNASNTDACLDIRAGGFSYYQLRDLWLFGKWQYGVVLDGAEVCTFRSNIVDINGGQANARGVWLVNGADRAVGQTVGFTNVITIADNQISGASGIGLLDDGGNNHCITGNNFNQFPTAAYFAGITNLYLKANSFEFVGAGSRPNNVVFQSKTFAGVPVGPVTGFEIGACGFYGNVTSGPLLNFATAQFNISNITKANPCVITLSTGGSLNPFFTQQFIYFASVGGMTQINGMGGLITAIGGVSGAWTVTIALDTSGGGYSAYTAGGTGQMLHSGGSIKGNNFGSQTGRTSAVDVTGLANSEIGPNYDAGISTGFQHYSGVHNDTNGNILRPPQNGFIPSLGTFAAWQGDTRYRAAFPAAVQETEIVVTYSASMTFDVAFGNVFEITATNGAAFTINSPSNAVGGGRFTVRIKNTSGGALGAVTWGASFKLAAWTSPATGNSRSITFAINAAGVAVEVSRCAADVPN